MDLGLKGKKAIITGATRGIGRRIADILAAEGCDIAICARKPEEVEEAVTALKAHGTKVLGSVVNVKDAEPYKAWLVETAEKLGGCDIFIPNVSAGGGMDGEKNWYRNFEIDLMGAVRGCEALMPALKESGHGSIVFIGTTAAVETFMAPMAYNALKAALITYAKQLSQVTFRRNIRVNVVSPGPIIFEGGSWEQIKASQPQIYESTLAQQPSGRMGEPEEVARCVVFLASPAASWVTGTNLIVDGGMTKRVQF
ncbi:SDR family NAD(P)-dependent oxidoreductase [uncultured Alsobacter sp.]|uniref:SDR family NAD(P)-dependent oxidoreductase n=1 Tax=uncultured Alsobacter sp. TaxID=1748258 RepID=UPI0025EFC75B|nr:SDR family NAD(P)-dependent oxidoreductase [uncultured Alsobacter sp.]